MLHEIGGRPVGPGHAVFVVAEIGLNHSGSVDKALAMVDAAAWAGASAVKLQTLQADELVSASCPPPAHVAARSLRDFFAAFELDADAHRAVVRRARDLGLAVMATPFAESLVGMLESLGIDAFKIASGDLPFDGLIRAAAATGRPVVLSTGMSALLEVGRAVDVARGAGTDAVGVLHCVSAYPTPPDCENLRAIATLERYLRVPVGLSDHGTCMTSAIAAVALGACIYERHLVLESDSDAIDRAVSSTPEELKSLIEAMERVRVALGDGRKVCQPAEQPNLIPSRRGLYAARLLKAGSRVGRQDVMVVRPATTLPPSHLPGLIGSVLTRDVDAGSAFLATDIRLERAS
ncbi:MAG TPA: N-acetylneuraminate synthase family protein [Vicinamibacterales bacterium]|nr:N-acetylneuraminate synthase family protein [Vicinamibacterales bacterium]